jgi:methylglutaconyl-CoA hydratase
MSDVVEVHQEGPVLTVALNRPESHNAFSPEMSAAVMAVFQEIDERDDVRVVVLTGNGRSFCAGGDLNAMRAASDFTFDENVRDGEVIFDLMWTVDRCRKPVVGRVNGAAIGGGVGLVSCCDIVIAVDRAEFGFSETRLGLVPAVISPFVIAKIGPTAARELFLTGKRFDAHHAQQLGLVNSIVPEIELDGAVSDCIAHLLQAAPGAQAAAKELIRTVAYQPKEAVREYTTHLIARLRASDEGREGMSAFLEKRKPDWQ